MAESGVKRKRILKKQVDKFDKIREAQKVEASESEDSFIEGPRDNMQDREEIVNDVNLSKAYEVFGENFGKEDK